MREYEWWNGGITHSENSMKASVAGVKRKPSCRRHGERETERPDHVGPVDYCEGAISQGKGKQLEATISKLWIEDDTGSDQSGSGEDGLQCSYMNT